MTREEIGVMIAAARGAAGLTQRGLADLLGISKGAVSAWEQGRAVPTGARAVDLAAVLGHSPQWLETGTDPDGWTPDKAQRGPALQARIDARTPEAAGRKFRPLVEAAIEEATNADAMRGQIVRKIANLNEAQLGAVLSMLQAIKNAQEAGLTPAPTAVDDNGEG